MKILKYFCVYAALILSCYAFHFFTRSPVIPFPHESIFYFITNLGSLFQHLVSSLGRMFIATALAAVLGMLIGIVVDEKKAPASHLLEAFTAMPLIVLRPILTALYGYQEWIIVLVLFFLLICPYIRAARRALADTDPNLRLYVESMGLTFKDRLVHTLIPAMLPSVFRMAVRMQGLVFAALFFIENNAAYMGIGGYIMDSWATGSYVEMNAGIIAVCLMASLIYPALEILKRVLCPHLYHSGDAEPSGRRFRK